MLETLQGDLGYNRRVEGLCSCVSYQLVHDMWAVMNQWTVPLEWNGGMEYWNDL